MFLTRIYQSIFQRWRSFANSDLSVDFVLAYDEQGDHRNVEKRQIFESNLETVGLLLEREENQRIHFVKIHVPREVLCQYAEILKLRLPIRDVSNINNLFIMFVAC